jgi:hypothetical protein
MRLRLSIALLAALLPVLPALADQTPQQIADAEIPSLLAIYKDCHTHP